jgi:hypothetical protein
MDARDHDRVEGVGILRLTTWATAAAVAITVAALASMSPGGSQRVTTAVASWSGGDTRQRTQVAARTADIETDRRSLNEALRLLASDRDRLMTRVGSIERNLDDITGSIKSQNARPLPESTSMREAPNLETLPPITAEAATAAKPSRPADLPDWLANVPEPWPSPSSGRELATGPASFPPGPASTPAQAVRVSALPVETARPGATVVSRTEFGVDIGSGSDMNEVRALWDAAKTQHGRLLGNLRPIVVKREDRAGNPDYRLVIGPLANAGSAAMLCAKLGAADVMCSTRQYQGERLTP